MEIQDPQGGLCGVSGVIWESQGGFWKGLRVDFWHPNVDLGVSKIDFGVQDGFCGGARRHWPLLVAGRTQVQISQCPQFWGLWGFEDSQGGFWSFTMSFALSRMDLGISGCVLGFWSRFLEPQVGFWGV